MKYGTASLGNVIEFLENEERRQTPEMALQALVDDNEDPLIVRKQINDAVLSALRIAAGGSLVLLLLYKLSIVRTFLYSALIAVFAPTTVFIGLTSVAVVMCDATATGDSPVGKKVMDTPALPIASDDSKAPRPLTIYLDRKGVGIKADNDH